MPENTADDINFKKDKRQIADDSQAETDKPQPHDKYALNCKSCNTSMLLQNNVHTTALLIQFYKFKCVYNDCHIIVRDKRTNQSVVHRSKGMHHTIAVGIRRLLLLVIVNVSKLYWIIISLIDVAVVDALPGLIVDEHMIEECMIKEADLGDDIDRLKNIKLTLDHILSFEEYDGIGDITAMKYVILMCEAMSETCAFVIWFNSLAIDTYDQMVRLVISYMNDIYVHEISDGDLDDYRRLVDMIECMSAIIDDLCDRAIDGKYDVNRDVVVQAHRLIITILADGGMSYDLCMLTLELAMAICQLKGKVTSDSMTILLDKLSAFACKRKIAPNTMEASLRRLVRNAVDVMTRRLKCCGKMTEPASIIEVVRSKQKKVRDRLEVQLANRTSTALDTMHN